MGWPGHGLLFVLRLRRKRDELAAGVIVHGSGSQWSGGRRESGRTANSADKITSAPMTAMII